MKKFLFLAVILVMALGITACSNDNGDGGSGSVVNDGGSIVNDGDSIVNDSGSVVNDGGSIVNDGGSVANDGSSGVLAGIEMAQARFPSHFDTGAAHVEGTTLMIGLSAASPWPGILGGAVFSTAAEDSDIAAIAGLGSGVLSVSAAGTWGQDGIATFSHDLENHSITLTQTVDVFWHDGMPLTMADLAYAYYVLANPDYTGIRFSGADTRVIGIMDYHNGYADSISGLVLSDDNRTLTIYFDNLTPDMMFPGSFWTAPMPRHIFENIPVAEMANSPYVLTNPIGWGPFIVEHVIPGESVMFVRNDNFVWGRPYIERVVLERVAPELAGSAMASGRYDVLLRFNDAFYEDYSNPTNFQFLGDLDRGYQHISFRLGHFDYENNVNVYSPNRNMSNPALRRAMALAIDHTSLSELLFSGLQFPATSIMTPNFTGLMDLSVPPIMYNPALANQMLDEAGFTTRDADGYRNHPDGSPLTVIWAFAADPMEDIIVPLHINFWREIGVRVELWRGQTHAQVYLWDTLDYDTDNDEIDIYMARWTNINNPSPIGRWGHLRWNPSRYTSPELEAIFEGLLAEENWDEDNLRAAYSRWQWYVYEQAFYLPTRWRVNLTAVNNRVAAYNLRPHIPSREFGLHSIRLSAADPIR